MVFCNPQCFGRFKCGRKVVRRGYWHDQSGYKITCIGHQKTRLEHILVMERKLGRPLKKEEVVHHRDGDVSNNSIDNLELMTRSQHGRLHSFKRT